MLSRLGSLTLSTWFALIIPLIISPWQILGIFQPSGLCHGMSLLMYVLEVLMDFLGLSPYVCVVTHRYPEIHKTILFLNLKTIALSASQLLLLSLTVAMLMRCNKFSSKLLYSSTFTLSWALFEVSLTEGFSFYAYRIYLHKCSGVFPWKITYFSQWADILYICQQWS